MSRFDCGLRDAAECVTSLDDIDAIMCTDAFRTYTVYMRSRYGAYQVPKRYSRHNNFNLLVCRVARREAHWLFGFFEHAVALAERDTARLRTLKNAKRFFALARLCAKCAHFANLPEERLATLRYCIE